MNCLATMTVVIGYEPYDTETDQFGMHLRSFINYIDLMAQGCATFHLGKPKAESDHIIIGLYLGSW